MVGGLLERDGGILYLEKLQVVPHVVCGLRVNQLKQAAQLFADGIALTGHDDDSGMI